MALDDNQIVQYWLPEMMKLDWDLESELDSVVMRANINDTWDELEKHLEDDEWWRTASELEKARILRIYMTAFEVGLEDMALQIIRSLYEEGLRSEPYLINVSFDLVNPVTIAELETRAADLVKWVDQGTKTFIKRIITSGVRQGLSSPKIAQGIREGQAAEWILRQDDFMDDVEQLIRTGLVEMSEARSNSIVNTEINRAENQGKHKQMNESGLTTKKWVHLGERGVTDAGNQHPCPVCDANEKLGFVPMDYAYPTVFKTGGVDGKGGEHTPPGHPNVCHCTIIFNEDELFNLVEAGEYTPYTGN